jgi:hypothetical protein
METLLTPHPPASSWQGRAQSDALFAANSYPRNHPSDKSDKQTVYNTLSGAKTGSRILV